MTLTPFCPVCGAANEPAHTSCFACGEPLAPGTDETQELLRGRYQLGALLGAGGFSLVYLAKDLQEGERDVAIKRINLQGLNPAETIEATSTFNSEVKLLSSLHHPQIPQLYDHFHDSDHWYLVLEYLAGNTLESYMAMQSGMGRPIPIDEALSMTLQLCDVLEYLHTCQPPIIFRDLKPGNVIRTPTGKLCLIDFGIARQYRPGQKIDTQRLGSPGYAAPEQYGRAQTTPQTDIFSLGALLHALLSGQDPSTQPRGLAPLHLSGFSGESELTDLVQQMLAPDPIERPASVSDVALVLKAIQEQQSNINGTRIWNPPTPQTPPEEHLTGSGSQRHIQLQVTAPPKTVPAMPQMPTPQRTSRRKLLMGLGAAAIALGAGETIWQIVSRIQPTPSATLLYTFLGHSDAVWGSYWSPNGTQIASCSLDSTVQVWDAFNGQNPFVYHGHSDGVMDASWSPDGKRIASASSDTTVQVWNASNGSNAIIYQGHTDTVQEANWSPDGKSIVSASLDGTVQVWDSTTGNLQNKYLGHSQPVTAAKWSPDGSMIASASEDSTVQIWDANTMRTMVTYQGHSGNVYEVDWSPDGKSIVSSGSDGTAQIWNAADGSHLITYTGHTQAVNGATWSHDGQRIASVSDDATVQIWNPFNGQHLYTYTGHSQPVIEALWSRGDKIIASASKDMSVQIWRI